MNIQQNLADYSGGAIFVGPMVGTNKLTITSSPAGVSSFIVNNHAYGYTPPAGCGQSGNPPCPWAPAERTFNTDPDFAYNAVWCTGGSTFSGLHLAPWTSRNPRLKGNGTCVFYGY